MAVRTISSAGIVIPCYNESQRLSLSAFDQFLKADSDVSFLFVDDGSQDATAEILAKLVSQHPERITAWRLEKNSGKAEAVRRGVNKAIELGYSQIGFWDADLATPLDAITDFTNILNTHSEIDVVWGSRTRLLGRRIRRHAVRYFIGRIFSNLSARAVNIPVYDASCGAKLFRNSSYLATLFQEKFYSRWIFDTEILSRLNRTLKRNEGRSATEVIYELPLNRWAEIAGSKLRSGTFVKAIFELLALAAKHRLEVFPPAATGIRQIEENRLIEIIIPGTATPMRRAA